MEYQNLRPFFRRLVDLRLKWFIVIFAIILIPIWALLVAVIQGSRALWESLKEVPALIRVHRPVALY